MTIIFYLSTQQLCRISKSYHDQSVTNFLEELDEVTNISVLLDKPFIEVCEVPPDIIIFHEWFKEINHFAGFIF